MKSWHWDASHMVILWKTLLPPHSHTTGLCYHCPMSLVSCVYSCLSVSSVTNMSVWICICSPPATAVLDPLASFNAMTNSSRLLWKLKRRMCVLFSFEWRHRDILQSAYGEFTVSLCVPPAFGLYKPGLDPQCWDLTDMGSFSLIRWRPQLSLETVSHVYKVGGFPFAV